MHLENCTIPTVVGMIFISKPRKSQQDPEGDCLVTVEVYYQQKGQIRLDRSKNKLLGECRMKEHHIIYRALKKTFLK